jgi:putative transcriptional regulator
VKTLIIRCPQQNLSILKTGKAKAIRFSTLEAICETLDCQPGEILENRPEMAKRKQITQT